MPEGTVTLRSIRDEDGVRYLGASLSRDGTLTIEGQDLGDGVERFFGPGNREYEWIWTFDPPQVAKLLAALDAGGDILTALQQRFSDVQAAGLGAFLEEHGIEYQSWSRIGD